MIDKLFHVLLESLKWMGLGLGLLIVTIIWVVIIFVVVDELHGLWLEFRTSKDVEIENYDGEY